MSDGENGLMASVMNLGEERMGELVGQLLQNDIFARALEGALSSSLKAKRNIDGSVKKVLSAASVPSVDDVRELAGRLGELEDAMADIEDRLSRLLDRFESETD